MYLCDKVQALASRFILSRIYDRYTKAPSWRNLAKHPTPRRGSGDAAECADAGLQRGHGHGEVWRMRGRGGAGVWQERTAQNGGRIFAYAAALGFKVVLHPPRTDTMA